MIIMDLLLLSAFGWVFYSRLSLNISSTRTYETSESAPVSITRPTMPKPLALPADLDVIKSTQTVNAREKPVSPVSKESKPEPEQKSVQKAPAQPKKPDEQAKIPAVKTAAAVQNSTTAVSEPAKQQSSSADSKESAPLRGTAQTVQKSGEFGPAPSQNLQGKNGPVSSDKAKESEPVEKAQKIVFEYVNSEADTVSIKGSFTKWQPAPMKQDGKYWSTSLYIYPGKYPYHFIVDGQKTLDPYQPLKLKGDSCLVVTSQD